MDDVEPAPDDDRGRPVGPEPVGAPGERLAALIASGAVRAPRMERQALPQRIDAGATVSDLVADQRR